MTENEIVWLVHYKYRSNGHDNGIVDRRDPVVAAFRNKGDAWHYINDERPRYTDIPTGTVDFWIERMELQ